jgi:hypothetical protein
MANFQNYFPLEAYKQFHQCVNESNHARYAQLLEEWFSPALNQFLLALKAEGRVQPITNAEGYSTQFLKYWNAFAQDDPVFIDNPARTLGIIQNRFSSMPLNLSFLVPKDCAVEVRYANFVEQINQGNLEDHYFESDYCVETGARLRYAFQQSLRDRESSR